LVEQPDLWADARAARDEAIEIVDAHAAPDWRHLADLAIARCAYENATFTCDRVWDYDLPATRENRALGARIKAAVRNGIIVPTDEFLPSKVPGHHMVPRRVWASLIYPSE
jgi:hypothetical protein